MHIVPKIEESIASTDPRDQRTVTQRYYTPLYRLDPDRTRREDLLVLLHSNRICLISLAPSHPVIAGKLGITKVNLEVSKNTDRKTNKTKGKSKKGGQNLEACSTLAILETDHSEFSVQAVVPGKLICINQAVLKQPDLLVTQHDSQGHLAIVLPSRGWFEKVREGLLTQQEYQDRVQGESQ